MGAAALAFYKMRRCCHASGGDGPATTILIGEDPVSLNLREKVERTEIDPPADKSSWYLKSYNYVATGRLTLQITNCFCDRMRLSWSDGKKQRLDDLLAEVIPAIEVASDRLREQRLELEALHRQWEEEARQREEMQNRIRMENERRSRLQSEVEGWMKARAIRRFCDDLESRANAQPEMFPPEKTAPWLKWARTVASNQDPFQNGYLQKALDLSVPDPAPSCSSEHSDW